MESFILAGTALILEKDIKKDQENSAHNYTDSSNGHDLLLFNRKQSCTIQTNKISDNHLI